MMETPAAIPALMQTRFGMSERGASTASIAAGAASIAALAQVSIPLPFTPVPITGQTFGVTLLSLLLGSRCAPASVAAYLAAGAAGLPVFARAAHAPWLGPTSGYLAGMLAASWVIGRLADRGAARSFRGAYLAGLAGSACIFAFGLTGLSFFVPARDLPAAGILPFLPGDLLKTALAAWIASRSAGGPR